MLTVCENGFGKRSALDEYRITNRGAQGVINIRVTDRNGPVVSVLRVKDEDDVMMMTQGGMIIRSPMEEVRVIGRATQGVRVINLKDNDKVVALARIPEDKDEDDEDGAEPADAETDAPEIEEPVEAEQPRTGRGRGRRVGPPGNACARTGWKSPSGRFRFQGRCRMSRRARAGTGPRGGVSRLQPRGPCGGLPGSPCPARRRRR